MAKRVAPVQVGQEITLEITGLGSGGEGVGRYEGFTFFVPGGVPGDRLRVRSTEVKKNYGRAEVVGVEVAAPSRVAPVCPVAHLCGGCQIQQIDYPEQLRLKQAQVEAALQRVGGLEGVPVRPVLGMADPWHYRNKAQFPLGWGDGQVLAGFYAPGSHEIVDYSACHIQHPLSNRVIEVVKKLAERYGVSIYDEERHVGVLRHVLVRVSFKTGEAMVVLVANGSIPRGSELAAELMASLPEVVSVQENINERPTNVILGARSRVLAGSERLMDYVGDLRFAISPRSFFQVNSVQTEVLYEQALAFAGLTGHETVIDAYCGIGTISLFLAQRAERVIGIEVVPEAIDDARSNAELNGVVNASFLLGEAEVVMPRLFADGLRPEVIVVDPPRKGVEESALAAMVGMAPERIVYVSCNPATLARDLRYLAEHGYRTLEVQPVDMFPHTAHVECVVLMSRAEK